jgi:arylamine N-acetyltransferase
MLLVENNVTTNLGTQQVRYVHEPLAQLTAGQKFWIYQYRNSVEKEWNSFYAFTEHEFMSQDFDVMSWFTSTNGTVSFQTSTVLLVKFLRDDNAEKEGGSRIIGKLMLINETVKKNLGGKTEVLKVCETEEDRVEVLRDVFGISLSEEERGGIKGFGTELRKDVVMGSG